MQFNLLMLGGVTERVNYEKGSVLRSLKANRIFKISELESIPANNHARTMIVFERRYSKQSIFYHQC